MSVTVGGVDCPLKGLNDCSAMKKARFISCDFPAVEAGDKVVLVTDPDAGNSNTLTIAFVNFLSIPLNLKHLDSLVKHH